MTQAVCFKCGEAKRGAFNTCSQCGAVPRADDELMLSLAFSDHYFEPDKLQQIGSEIKAGSTPQLGDDLRTALAPAVQEAKRILDITRDVKRNSSPALRLRLRLLNLLRRRRP